jgi:hypothetical protein
MEIQIRPLRHDEVADADRIIRLAFGTFLGVPDPMQTFGDSDFAYTRYEAAPDAAPRWRRKRMASWWARTSSQTGAASGFSDR